MGKTEFIRQREFWRVGAFLPGRTVLENPANERPFMMLEYALEKFPISMKLREGTECVVRPQPQMVFDWETNRQQLPVDAGVGRVFKIGPQYVNCFKHCEIDEANVTEPRQRPERKW